MRPLHSRTHPNLDVPGCFGCKAASIQFSMLDVSLDKKWNAELDYYSDLRKQGIQPAGTTMAKCEEADRFSQEIQQAFDADNPMKHVDLSSLEEA